MGNCDRTWTSKVDNEDDGTLNLTDRVHHKPDGDEEFEMVCGRNLIIINKTGHVYIGILVRDGFYEGTKISRKKPKPTDDEPTDGTWTAEKGPGQDGGKKTAQKANTGKAAKGGTKKAAKSGRKK